MFFNGGSLAQFHLGTLANYSYLLCSSAGAILVDPGRNLQKYEDFLENNQIELCGVFLTHMHEDQICGHTSAGKKYSIPVYVSRNARAAFPHVDIDDDAVFNFGRLKLHFFYTPGHSGDSVCMAAGVDPDTPDMLFVGDALCINESDPEWLHHFAGLPGKTRLYPAHENPLYHNSWTTWEEERCSNPVFNHHKKFPPLPEYLHGTSGSFSRCEMNRKGPDEVDHLHPFIPADPENVSGEVIDIRSPGRYAAAHIPGSMNVDANGKLEQWIGRIIDPVTTVVTLVGDSEHTIANAAERLQEIGCTPRGIVFRNYFEHNNPVAHIDLIPPEQLKEMQQQHPLIIDVRSRTDFDKGHIPDAENIPLKQLAENPNILPRDRRIVVVCGTGFLSGIACGLLEKAQFKDVCFLNGGTAGWLENGNRITRKKAV